MFAPRRVASPAFLLLSLASAAAQGNAQAVATRGTPGIISGLVLDSLSRPIASAEVFYGDERVRAVAGADGSFRFADVRRGAYTVTARRFGFVPQSIEVTVSDSGATIWFSMTPLVATLAPAVTVAKRTGIGGIVTDSAFRPLKGVRIDAPGGAARAAVTDSVGRFHMNAVAGQYIVRVTLDGYRSVTTSLNVPKDEGREVDFRLIPDAGYSLVRERIAAVAQRQRLATRSPSGSRLYTREDLAQRGVRNMDDLVRRSGLGGSACVAILDGEFLVPTWAIDIADVEYVELYAGGGGVARRSRSGATPRLTSASACIITAYVWMRR